MNISSTRLKDNAGVKTPGPVVHTGGEVEKSKTYRVAKRLKSSLTKLKRG